MTYNFNIPFDCISAQKRLDFLIAKKAKAEITEKKNKRTLDQNALFHLWIKVFADNIGEHNLDSVKRDVKRTLLGQIEVTNRFTGEIQLIDYKTSVMDTTQMSDFMTKFKEWAFSDYGCYLPDEKDRGYAEMLNNYDL